MKFLIISCLAAISHARFLQQEVQTMDLSAVYPGGFGNQVGVPFANGGFVQFQLPDFLTATTEEARQEFGRLATDMNRPRSDVEADMDAWAQKYGVKAQFDQFKQDMANKKAELTAAVRELVAKLPSTLDQMEQIENNKALSGKEVIEQVKSTFSSMGDRVMKAIGSIVNVFVKKTDGGQIQPFPGTGGQLPEGNGGFTGGQGGFPGNGNNNINNNNGFNGQGGQQGGFTGGFPAIGTGSGGFNGGNGENAGNGQQTVGGQNGGAVAPWAPGQNPNNQQNGAGFQGQQPGFGNNNGNQGGFQGNQGGATFPQENNGFQQGSVGGAQNAGFVVDSQQQNPGGVPQPRLPGQQ